jgi:tetratricopeptide (TPR) repeat protein
MMRHLRSIALGLAVTFAAPAYAQMSFEGLDLSGDKRKKPAPKKKKAADKDKDKDEQEGDESDEVPLPSGGLDLTKPAPSGGKAAGKGAAKASPTMTFDSLDVSGKSQERQKLDVAVNLFKDKRYDQAALHAFEIMEDPKFAGLHAEAHYLLAKALYRLGLYHSSLIEFTKVLERGPQSKFFNTSLEWLFFISRKTVNEAVVLETIARYSNFPFPERFRNEFRYLLARYHFVRGRALDEVGQKEEADKSYDQVKRLLLQIPEQDVFHPRAKYLEGLAYFREANFGPALESMKQVVRLTRMRPGESGSDRRFSAQLRELAMMQLARTHYGHRQNRYAIHYLNRIERGTSQWLEALFEASWAHYRVGQYEQALGNLITLSSPFFRDEYFPEAMILKAVIYYENCRYRESTMIVEDFERLYLPVHDELEMMLARNLDASEYYNVLADVQRKNTETLDKGSTDLILERVLRLALTDKDLKKTNDSILELETELASFNGKQDAFRYSNLVKALSEDLKVQRESLISKAGLMAQGKLQFELGELKRLLADGLRIKFETTTKEKEFLEQQLQSDGKKDIVKTYRYSVAVADDQLYWPYKGEYWRDELGTYQYTLTKGCVDRESGNKLVSGSAAD